MPSTIITIYDCILRRVDRESFRKWGRLMYKNLKHILGVPEQNMEYAFARNLWLADVEWLKRLASIWSVIHTVGKGFNRRRSISLPIPAATAT